MCSLLHEEDLWLHLSGPPLKGFVPLFKAVFLNPRSQLWTVPEIMPILHRGAQTGLICKTRALSYPKAFKILQGNHHIPVSAGRSYHLVLSIHYLPINSRMIMQTCPNRFCLLRTRTTICLRHHCTMRVLFWAIGFSEVIVWWVGRKRTHGWEVSEGINHESPRISYIEAVRKRETPTEHIRDVCLCGWTSTTQPLSGIWLTHSLNHWLDMQGIAHTIT